MTGSADAQEFYDDYVDRQTAVGINERHMSILGWLQRFGLEQGNRVVEIGCGVGTVTELIAKAIGPSGSVLGIDLSPRSIAVARERLQSFSNVELRAVDVAKADLGEMFDVAVLPDVIEHIPLEQHDALFARLASSIAVDGFVLLHYPNPHHIEWQHEHDPSRLQVIDQPVHADELLGNVYRHGLYLDYYETYTIWHEGGDYIVAVLRPRAGLGSFPEIPQPAPSLRTRAWNRLRPFGR